MYHIKSDEGTRVLAAAIIESACKDYAAALKRAYRAELKGKSITALYDAEVIKKRFFYTPYFGLLTDLDPDYLMQQIEEMIKEEIKNERNYRKAYFHRGDARNSIR